jgi:predicted dehydrogenase
LEVVCALSALDPINVAVIGAGAFGRNHARVYDQLQRADKSVRLAAIVDSEVSRAVALAKEYSESDPEPFGSVAEMIASAGNIQAASVTVPTAEHFKVASGLMEAGIDVLIEKPLTTTLAEGDELIRLAQRAARIAQVGHLERFNPCVRATLPIVTRPMFFEVHRLSVFTPRSLDIDVVLDLMIHDLDIVLSLVNSPVKEVRAVGLPILSTKVDIANVRLEFDSGCVANFTASRVSTERVRKLRFFQPQQYVSIDYTRQDVLLFTVTGSPDDSSSGTAWHGKATHRSASDIEGPGDRVPGREQRSAAVAPIELVKPPVVPGEPLHMELQAFVEAVRGRSKPLVSLEDGRRALALALEISAAIAEHSRRANLNALGPTKR